MINSLFQSVTLRTCGFNTVDQGALRDSSMVMGILFMLIGGSSGSTAGGIKTATVGVLLLTVRAGILGREEVTLYGRAISSRRVMNAVTLALTVFLVFLASSMLISVLETIPYLHAAFETASAMGTVGLSTGITTALSDYSKGLIICLMYLGRVGMLSFSIAFLTKMNNVCKIKHPTFDIMIG
jgi:trk system potassium uptake protein TrkH